MAGKPWFVAEARARKADLIAEHLAARGLTARDALDLDDEQRRAFEVEAGARAPASAETWRSVIEMLAGSVMPAAACLTCGAGDPSGIPGPRRPHGHPGPCAH